MWIRHHQHVVKCNNQRRPPQKTHTTTQTQNKTKHNKIKIIKNTNTTKPNKTQTTKTQNNKTSTNKNKQNKHQQQTKKHTWPTGGCIVKLHPAPSFTFISLQYFKRKTIDTKAKHEPYTFEGIAGVRIPWHSLPQEKVLGMCILRTEIAKTAKRETVLAETADGASSDSEGPAKDDAEAKHVADAYAALQARVLPKDTVAAKMSKLFKAVASASSSSRADAESSGDELPAKRARNREQPAQSSASARAAVVPTLCPAGLALASAVAGRKARPLEEIVAEFEDRSWHTNT